MYFMYFIYVHTYFFAGIRLYLNFNKFLKKEAEYLPQIQVTLKVDAPVKSRLLKS